MKTKSIFVMAALAVGTLSVMTSCGGTAKTAVADNVPTRVKRTVDPTYTLAKQETDKLRAAQSATSYIENVALENAENAAATALASRLESAIIGVRERWNRNNQINEKTLTEEQVKNYMKTFVSQKVSYRVIGEPSIYDNADKTITAYICVELNVPTEKVLGEAYDQLTKDEVLSTEFDKQQFVKENLEELEKLKKNIGL